MESILTSIKKLLGIAEDDTSFDPDIIMHINSVFMILRQLGVGPEEGFRIEGKDATWSDFTEDITLIESIKTYIFMKVKIIFDPPSNSSVIEATNRIITELEWRLNATSETKF